MIFLKEIRAQNCYKNYWRCLQKIKMWQKLKCLRYGISLIFGTNKNFNCNTEQGVYS